MGRKPKYDDSLLISLIQELLPDGALGWKTVAEHYHVNSEEKELRDYQDVKKYWTNTLCNKMNKPTGKTGGRTASCQKIQREILEKNSAMTFSSDEDDEVEEELQDTVDDFEEEMTGEVAREIDFEAQSTKGDPFIPPMPDPTIPRMPSLPTTTPLVPRIAAATASTTRNYTIPTTSYAKKLLPKTKNLSVHGKRGNVLSSIDRLTESITSDNSSEKNDMMMMFMMQNMKNNNNHDGDNDYRILTLERKVQTLSFELETLESKYKRLKEDVDDEIRRLKRAKNDD